MKKNSVISLEKLNGMLANIKADKKVAEASLEPTVRTSMSLRKIRLKGHPETIYAFSKAAGNEEIVMVDIVSGATRLVSKLDIVSMTDVKDKFRLKGVTYGLIDTINGHKRYRPLSCEPRKDRHKMSVNGKEVVSAEAEIEGLAEDQCAALWDMEYTASREHCQQLKKNIELSDKYQALFSEED